MARTPTIQYPIYSRGKGWLHLQKQPTPAPRRGRRIGRRILLALTVAGLFYLTFKGAR